jgi:hypothetical protein
LIRFCRSIEKIEEVNASVRYCFVASADVSIAWSFPILSVPNSLIFEPFSDRAGVNHTHLAHCVEFL